jgi:hypothetical protein
MDDMRARPRRTVLRVRARPRRTVLQGCKHGLGGPCYGKKVSSRLRIRSSVHHGVDASAVKPLQFEELGRIQDQIDRPTYKLVFPWLYRQLKLLNSLPIALYGFSELR